MQISRGFACPLSVQRRDETPGLLLQSNQRPAAGPASRVHFRARRALFFRLARCCLQQIKRQASRRTHGSELPSCLPATASQPALLRCDEGEAANLDRG